MYAIHVHYGMIPFGVHGVPSPDLFGKEVLSF